MTYTAAERNKAINKASTDLLNIISCHDAEAHHLVSRVWDRLDRLVAHFERLKTEECAEIAETCTVKDDWASEIALAIRQHSQKGEG